MDNQTRRMLTSYLNEIRTRYKNEQFRLDQLEGYESKQLKRTQIKNNKSYYSVFVPDSDTYKYLGSEKDDTVIKIKEAHYLSLSTKSLQREIRAVERFLKQSKGISYEDINSRLARVYRDSISSIHPHISERANNWKQAMEKYKATFPPFRPDELVHPTHDGSNVRSKSEALIYNYLLEMGITFIYELPLKIVVNNKKTLLLPDFTILSEIDYKTIIFLEHQGMMSNPKYKEKFNDAVYKYWLNNYLPEKNVFFTFDSPNGVLDDSPIKNIVARYVRPECA